MGSLSELLTKEGFHNSNSVKSNTISVNNDNDSVSLPIYICHSRKSFHLPKHKRTSSKSRHSSFSNQPPAIDEAVISILSGYAGKYLKDSGFRESLREKCSSCIVRRSSDELLLGIESIDKLIDNPGMTINNKELKLKSLRNSLTKVVSLNSSNYDVLACAHFYLAILYKIEKNDRICAIHILQVFVESPQLARTHLLPDLWDHFFLPHLLHLKIWFNTLSDDGMKLKLSKVYEDQMDMGTLQFALYYKQWLQTGGQPPPNLPSVPVPSTKLLSQPTTTSSFNKLLLEYTIVGVPVEKQPSMEANQQKEEEEQVCRNDYSNNILTTGLAQKPSIIDLSRAITTCESLAECEMAVREITKAWLDNPLIENTLSKPSIIEALLQVLFASSNEEILELVISLLTELVSKNEQHAKIILNLDPQLSGFMNLMRNNSLFLKASSLLYLVKPEAKQMISIEWIPLVLRVLEFGDQTQILFSVRCSPHVAAYYFLDQLLNSVDQDRNLENGRQVISLGGLGLLLTRMEIGDTIEKINAMSVIYCCIKADGRCRHYLAHNLNTNLILELLVRAKEFDSNEITVCLLAELICIRRFEERIKLFEKLLTGWDCLNTMQILLVCLQTSTREKRPLVAAIMLQLDLMGDSLKSSVYRQEAIEALTNALDPQICNENAQQQANKALLILGGRYAYTGTPETEQWIMKQAGYNESFEGGRYYSVVEASKHTDECDEIEQWQRKAAMVLWTSGGKRLISALSESIANGIPCLSRTSLVTVAWMSKFVYTVGDADILQSINFSTLVRRLIQSLNPDNTLEHRVLSSFSLLSLSTTSGLLFEISEAEKKEMMIHLRNISKFTWTAKRLASIISGSQSRRHSGRLVHSILN